MHAVKHLIIDGYDIDIGVYPVLVDPEGTKKAIAQDLNIPMDDVSSLEDLGHYIEQYAVYPRPMLGELYITDNEAEEIKFKLASLEEHERLTRDGKKIPDWSKTKYYLKTGDTWTESEITAIGVELPEGAVLPGALTPEQQTEIAVQKEAERIAALDPEAKDAEKQARLNALADEADRLSRRAQIRGEDFDAAAWYRENKGPIEEKYA
jgi:hypothetical protein